MRRILLTATALVATAGAAMAQLPAAIYQPGGPKPIPTPVTASDGVVVMRAGQAYTANSLTALAGTITAAIAPIVPGNGTIARTLSALFGRDLDPVDFGADPTGVADSAPAWRAVAAIASGHRIVPTPGTYRFASTVAAPCCAFNPTAVLFQGQGNFEVDGHHAVTIVADPTIPLSNLLHFDQDQHFRVAGINLTGNRTGLTTSQENSGVTLSSVSDADVGGLHCTGFGDNGACLGGDWIVSSRIHDIQGDNVGHLFDLAQINTVSISDNRAVGGGSAAIGQTAISLIHDTPNLGQNHTGQAYVGSVNIELRGNKVSNFNTALLLETGAHVVSIGNDWGNSPSVSGTPGIGVYLLAQASAAGYPLTDFSSVGDSIHDNGGYGVLIQPDALSGSDTMGGIAIRSALSGNGVGADTTTAATTTNLPGLVIDPAYGAAETQDITARIGALATYARGRDGSVKLTGHLILPNNVTVQGMGTDGVNRDMLFIDALNEQIIRIPAAGSDVQVQDQNGNTLAQFYAASTKIVNQMILSTVPTCAAGLVSGTICAAPSGYMGSTVLSRMN